VVFAVETGDVVIEIPLGQVISHFPVVGAVANPQASMARTMASARRAVSGRPCGSNARWETLALMKSMAEAFRA